MAKNINLNTYFYFKSEIDNFLSNKANKNLGSNNARKNVVTDANGNITTEDKPHIPEYISELTNDSGFLTQHQDISGKLDKAQGSSKASKNVVTDSNGNITTEAKPTIPTKVSQLTNDSGFLTSHQDISGKLDKAQGSTNANKNVVTNASGQITTEAKPSIPTAISDLIDDSDFITQNNLSNYVLKSSTAGLIRNDGSIDTNSYLTEHQDISGKVDKAQGSNKASQNVVTDSNGNITTEAKPTIPTKVSQLTNDSGFLTSHQDISEKANVSDVNNLAEQIDDIVAGDLDLTTYAKTTDLATVATSGSYNDLNNKPTLSSLGGDITITKQGTPETGFAATYVLKQGNTTLSPKINIPKDQFVQSASLVTVGSTPNTLESTNNLSAGDVYIKMVVNTENTETGATTLAIPVNELVDTYNADNTTLQLSNNTFSVKDGGITLEKLSSSLQTTINNKANSSDVPSASSTTPKADTDGGKIGSGTTWAKADHQHPLSDAYATSEHSHGSLTKEGILNNDITSVNKVAVTDSSNNLKTINKLPANKVTHQDISGKANVSDIPTKTSQLTNDGDGTNVFVKNNDSRLTDDRKPINNKISANSDLNDCTAQGFYYCQGDTEVAPTVTNQPLTTNQRSFGMLVEQMSATRTVQILTYYYTKDTYTRTNVNGNWSTWNRIIHDGNLSEYVDSALSSSSTNPLTNARITTALGDKLNLTGGTMTGNIKMPSEYQSTSGATGNIPFAGHLDKSSQSLTDALPTLKSLVATIKTNDDTWWNILSMRHRNGSNDGNRYGLYLKSLLTDNGDLIWNKQYGSNGTWVGERTILDSNNYSTYAASNNHTHTKLVSNGALPSTATQFADYKNEGYYTCDAGNSTNITDKPYTGNYSCIIENKRYDDYTIIQFVYKMPGSNISEIYYRKWTKSGDWTDWKKIANYDEIPTKTSQLTNDGDGTNVFIKNNDTRLTNARTPTSHTHNKSDINFTAISSGNDLDSFVTNGYYSCTSNASTSVTNKPAMFPSSGANFVLVVEQFGQYIFQTMEMISSGTANSRLYFRSKTSVGWSEWKECYSGKKAYYVATEEDPLDLNDFIEKGVFTFAKSGNANGKLSNSPIFGYALYVENQEYNADNIIQIAKTITTSKNNNRIFYRVYTGSTWATNGEWNEIVTNNKIDTALSSTSTNPVQNSVINTALDGKAPLSHSHDNVVAGGASGFMTGSDKTKLNGIATGATKNTVTNSLTSTSTTNALSAKMGNQLSTDKADKTSVIKMAFYSSNNIAGGILSSPFLSVAKNSYIYIGCTDENGNAVSGNVMVDYGGLAINLELTNGMAKIQAAMTGEFIIHACYYYLGYYRASMIGKVTVS